MRNGWVALSMKIEAVCHWLCQCFWPSCGYSSMKDTHWKKVRHSNMLRCRFSSCKTSPIPICRCYARLISNGCTGLACDSTQGSTGRASGTQSLIAQTFNLPVPPRGIHRALGAHRFLSFTTAPFCDLLTSAACINAKISSVSAGVTGATPVLKNRAISMASPS